MCFRRLERDSSDSNTFQPLGACYERYNRVLATWSVLWTLQVYFRSFERFSAASNVFQPLRDCFRRIKCVSANFRVFQQYFGLSFKIFCSNGGTQNTKLLPLKKSCENLVSRWSRFQLLKSLSVTQAGFRQLWAPLKLRQHSRSICWHYEPLETFQYEVFSSWIPLLTVWKVLEIVWSCSDENWTCFEYLLSCSSDFNPPYGALSRL